MAFEFNFWFTAEKNLIIKLVIIFPHYLYEHIQIIKLYVIYCLIIH